MIHFKSASLATPLSSFYTRPCCSLNSTASWNPPRTRPHYRTFADVRTDGESSSSDPYTWPDPIHPHRAPTPYQILRLNKSDTYSKTTFHSLVKLYHPDRVKHLQSPPIPHHILLERYRLLVAAHTILSDPSKRSAYDRFGAGWTGISSSGSSASADTSSWYYEYDRGAPKKKWRPGEDPMCNATWEDWEKWHSRMNPDRVPQKPGYMSNGTFLAFLLAFAAVGTVAQRGRAERFQERVVEQRERAHVDAKTGLGEARARGKEASDREDSIREFLRRREKNGWEDDAYRSLLSDEEVERRARG